MDIKDMQLFLTMAEERNITRTAEKIGYTQSGVSHILKNLEKELGFTLFARSQKGLTLTKNGEALLPYIKHTLSSHEHVEQQIAAINGIQEGRIAIGSYVSASINWLPVAIRNFREKYPRITVDIYEAGFEKIEEWLQSSEIDFAITSSFSSDNNNDWIPLKTDPYLAICSPESQHASKKSFDLKDLETTWCMLLERGNDTDLQAYLEKHHIHPMYAYSSLNDFTMIAMARENLGICVLPELVTRNMIEGLVALPLDPPVQRTLGISIPSLAEASPATRLFIESLQEVVKKLS